jgi:hypothetical protein
MNLAARFAMVVLATAAYLGLAILGWGGVAPFFSNTARVVLAIVTLAMGVVAMFAGGNVSSGVREHRGNRWIIPAFGAIGLLDGFLPAYTDRIDFWTIDGDAIRWSGIAIFTAGGVLWPVFVLGRHITPASRNLLNSGAYPRHLPKCRHRQAEVGGRAARRLDNADAGSSQMR